MNEDHALTIIPGMLSQLLGGPVESTGRPAGADCGVDAELHVAGRDFLIQYKSSGTADLAAGAVRQLKRSAAERPQAVLVLVVPYMGEVGKLICRAEGVAWFDLSGNADLTAAGILVRIEGRPNSFKRPGRPRDLFAPRSSRLARSLLLWRDRTFTQDELAAESGLPAPSVSRLVPVYQDAGFIERRKEGRKYLIRLADFDRLLDAWLQAYDFSMHAIRRGHVAARSGEELLEQVAATLGERKVDYAATGLSSAWLIEPFAVFRLVTVYVRDWPDAETLEAMRFRPEPRGSNLWLVRPKDSDVFRASEISEGVRHVSTLQTYLDLKAQPERSADAAEVLRRRLQGEAHE
jgi:hypothetical protein